jgi:hypothetical protein
MAECFDLRPSSNRIEILSDADEWQNPPACVKLLAMSTNEIIDQIKALQPEERAKVR